jgi:acyl-CoA reductase-like NAD-dependent aldehyde dehydrogenase
MFEQQFAARHFNVVQQFGRRVDAALVAHETDGSISVNGNTAGGDKSGF